MLETLTKIIDVDETANDIKECVPSFLRNVKISENDSENIYEPITRKNSEGFTDYQRELLIEEYGMSEEDIEKYSDWDDFENRGPNLTNYGDCECKDILPDNVESNTNEIPDELEYEDTVLDSGETNTKEFADGIEKNNCEVKDGVSDITESDAKHIQDKTDGEDYYENGTRGLTDQEKQRLKDKLGWNEEKINNNCKIDTDGVIQYKTDCQEKEGKSSDCGVPYVRKRFEYNGITIEGVFPEFDSVFDTKFMLEDYQSSSGKQFSECNKSLRAANENNPDLKKKFTKEQLEDIELGRTPRGYTWHHSEEPGKMQLVETQYHDKRIGGAAHTGGNSIWGNKSMDKSSDKDGQKGEVF